MAQLLPGDRVEIAPHYDLWMRGARYGTVTRTVESAPIWTQADGWRDGVTVVSVRMDRTDRVVRLPEADLTYIGTVRS